MLFRSEARKVLETYPNYPDSNEIFVFLGMRKAGWKMPELSELVIQTGLGLLLGIPLLGFIINLAFRWITR